MAETANPLQTDLGALDLERMLHPNTNLAALHRGAPLVLVRGKGVHVFDDRGKQYLEAMAGLWCTTLGYGDDELARTAYEQIKKLSFSHLFTGKSHEPGILLADKLVRMAPFAASRVFFGNSGSDANDTQIKLVTTLQGVDDSAYVDFTVAQQVAANLRPGNKVDVFASSDASVPGVKAEILAIDARVDPATRNATVRAKINDSSQAPAPGASVRVQVPVGTPVLATAVPASAVRKGPAGDHVFVVVADEQGKLRARLREVQVDAMAGDEVVITKGLEPGEQVAASGSFKLREAALVAVSNPQEAVARNESVSIATSM